MVKIGVVSQQNQQPEPPARKLNEDAFDCVQSVNRIVATVMDGIPVLRDAGGFYPNDNGLVASGTAARVICHAFVHEDHESSYELLRLFELANESIRVHNSANQTYEKTAPYWMATVGCALVSNLSTDVSYFGYIGDPLAFLISPNREVSILTEDQLRPFELHINSYHKSDSKDLANNIFIREHQDRYVRNVMDARCFCGERLRGWGALTGQLEAMDFVVVNKIQTPLGSRVILASDAIEAIGAGNGQERKVRDYQEALLSTLSIDPYRAAEALLRLTRVGEVSKGCKSDDATFVVVDF